MLFCLQAKKERVWKKVNLNLKKREKGKLKKSHLRMLDAQGQKVSKTGQGETGGEEHHKEEKIQNLQWKNGGK